MNFIRAFFWIILAPFYFLNKGLTVFNAVVMLTIIANCAFMTLTGAEDITDKTE